mgnify:CR=1 FL=1
MLTRGSELGLANLDDILVVAEQGRADLESVVWRGVCTGARTESKHDRERGRTRERDGMLTIHPDRAISVVHVTGVSTSSILRDSTEGTTTGSTEKHGRDIHLCLREIPAQNSIMDDIEKLGDYLQQGVAELNSEKQEVTIGNPSSEPKEIT